MAEFANRLQAYRIAKAEMDRHQYGEYPRGNHEAELEFDRLTDRLSTAHSDAMDALLLTKADSNLDLIRKLEITVAEQAHDNWHLAAPIMALLVDDARRLLNGGVS